MDRYGFKATFFEVYDWIDAGYHDKDISITWPEIAALQQDGMDIESHTMTHPDLNHKSQADLNYEIGQSKQCLENHGFNPTIFAYPNSEGSDDPKVINTVAKYYDLARTDTKSALTFLHCDGDNNEQQTDCRTHFNDGTLTPSNRYSINSWAHKHMKRAVLLMLVVPILALVQLLFAMNMTTLRCLTNSLQLLITKVTITGME